MLVDGVELTSTAVASGLTIEKGTAFPSNPSDGQLFKLNAAVGNNNPGLYSWDAATSTWLTGDITDVVAGNGLTGGGAAGSVTLSVDMTYIAANMPAIAITDTYVVASQVAMLALSDAQIGDIAVRTDLSKSFVLRAAGPSTLANWQELLSPNSPTLTSTATFTTWTGVPYDIGFSVFDKPTAGETVFRFKTPRAFNIPATGHVCTAGIAATGSATYRVLKNGTSIGTLVFAAAGTTPTISITATSFAIGDTITVTAPGTADATLADVNMSFLATLA